jgi:GNAT superfamily N-acetyltransferase
MPEQFAERLEAHLRSWVGAWPPPSPGLNVIGDPARLEPTWDGAVRPFQGVGDGVGTVIAVPPEAVAAVRAALADGLSALDRPGLGDDLGRTLGVGPAAVGTGVFRTTDRVAPDLADLGEWFEHQVEGLPEWLAPFNGPRLVAFDDGGRALGGVGIKVHDRFGHEIAVVTEERARGTGIARRLVATAARRILDEGAVPTYLHPPTNLASARVAEAVGFPDRGWTVHGLWPRS